jgi:hypothetical protein
MMWDSRSHIAIHQGKQNPYLMRDNNELTQDMYSKNLLLFRKTQKTRQAPNLSRKVGFRAFPDFQVLRFG